MLKTPFVYFFFPQGAKELAHPPTLTDIFQNKFDKAENKEEEDSGEKQKEEEPKQGMKRKLDHSDDSTEENAVDSQLANGQKLHDRHFKKAKNVGLFIYLFFSSFAINYFIELD